MKPVKQVSRVEELVRLISPYFYGEAPNVVFATLVDLSARWVLSHFVTDDEGRTGNAAATVVMQQKMMAEFVKGVATLVAQGPPPPIEPPSKGN